MSAAGLDGRPEGATHYAGADGDFTWFRPARGGWRIWSEVHKNWLWAGPSRPSWVKEIPARASPPAPAAPGQRVKWESEVAVPEGTTHYSVRPDGLPSWLKSVGSGWCVWSFGTRRWFPGGLTCGRDARPLADLAPSQPN